jgi:hypothetical protein
MERRQDKLTALMIEAALHTTRTHGIEAAALAMAEFGVPRDVIIRVLVFRNLRHSTVGARIAFHLANVPSWRPPSWVTRYLPGAP